MCKYVGSACFIANAFAVTKRESFRLNDMRVMSEKVEVALEDENVVVDWTRQSVLAAFEYHSAMFEKRRDEVFRVNESKQYFTPRFMEKEFNCGLPDSIVEKMQQTIRSYIDSGMLTAVEG